jgi:hypothetical protein
MLGSQTHDTTKFCFKADQLSARRAFTSQSPRRERAPLLGCIMGDDWRRIDKETDYPELMVRKLH